MENPINTRLLLINLLKRRGEANFPFVNGRLQFETVDSIYNGRLHTSLQRKLKETN